MKTIKTPTGFQLDADGHESDAILQAWTWRFFRAHAKDLGGAAWRREPCFDTEAGALAWWDTVRAWYAIVHPGCDFEFGGSDLGAAFALRTQAVLGRYGVAIAVIGEDLGWTPITYTKRHGWQWQDGSYGLVYHFEDREPERTESESEDDYSDRISELVATVEGEIIRGLERGLRKGTFGRFEWEFVESDNYPVKI